MKKTAAVIFLCVVFFCFSSAVRAEEPSLSAKSAILMSADTGEVLYELNKDERLAPASITKIMTLLLAMEELDAGSISYDDEVTASARARSMGGSTIFLDEGEVMSVRELIKGICVASANDASVALAEFIGGTESEFVKRMNLRAEELGMVNTHFENTNGLDAEGHFSSAEDVAKMSRELMKHKDIFEFTTIWTDSLRDGKFGLANTNKLIRFYEGATGLKTGSTSMAGCSISATATRDNMSLIAVIMGAADSKTRFSEARALLDYGFSKYALWSFSDTESALEAVAVEKGESTIVRAVLSEPCAAITEKSLKGSVEIIAEAEKSVPAPIKKGQKLGTVRFVLGDKEIARGTLVAEVSVPRFTLFGAFRRFLMLLTGAEL